MHALVPDCPPEGPHAYICRICAVVVPKLDLPFTSASVKLSKSSEQIWESLFPGVVPAAVPAHVLLTFSAKLVFDGDEL